jgi:redox-sensitive bicupin YhaK (pirin superfamily)
VVKAGELQRITAGTGVTHSEMNPSPTTPVHFYQIWLLPERTGLTPSYEQSAFPAKDREGRFQLVAAPPEKGGALKIHQDAYVYLTSLRPGDGLVHPFRDGRHGWLQVLRGRLELNGTPLEAGDGAALSDESEAQLSAAEPAEAMLFDLA